MGQHTYPSYNKLWSRGAMIMTRKRYKVTKFLCLKAQANSMTTALEALWCHLSPPPVTPLTALCARQRYL